VRYIPIAQGMQLDWGAAPQYHDLIGVFSYEENRWDQGFRHRFF
jgi:hypothetical protein